MSEQFIQVMNGVRIKASEAAKQKPVQDAAILEAEEVCAGTTATGLATQYEQSTTIGTDSCERYEQFEKAAPDDGTRTQLFRIHTTQFGCTNMARHWQIVSRLAQAYFQRGGL